jgi:molecular chaperone GrpE
MKKKEPKTQIDETVIEEALAAVGDSPAASENKEPKEEETYERLVRVTADYENFRRRTQKEKSELVLYGNETLLREILPTLDNFERAVEHAKKTEDVASIRTGVELILSQLKTTLDRMGLSTQSSVGEPFDPLVHEAVNQIPSADHPPNTVLEEHQRAYFLHKRLLRPALVTVSKEIGPETSSEAEIPPKEVSDEKIG